MKRILTLTFVLCLAFALTACSNQTKQEASIGGPDSKILVAFFSCTGNTKKVAEEIAANLSAELFEIVPEEPYADEDLDANDESSRAMIEQHNEGRPAFVGSVEQMEDYDIVFLGYPIWWGDAPKIMCTFLESYDFAGKTIIPFCTSHSTGLGSSATDMHQLAANARWLEGTRFPSNAARRVVTEWIDELNIYVPAP